ncbi:sensor histidine kinase [Runella slithyformis]|nr:sensor histidine kinase [Runella slithyformis]
MNKIIYSTFFTTLFMAGISAYQAIAQTPPQSSPPQSPYERLLETQKDYEAAMKTGDSLEVAEMCYRMGKRYAGLKNFSKAQEWFLRALRIREPLGPSEDIGKIYIQIAGFQIYFPNTAKTLHYNYMAYINFRAGKSWRSQMEANKLLGHLHAVAWESRQPLPYTKATGSPDSAVYYAERSLQAAKKVDNPSDIGLAYGFLGDVWKLKNNPQKSSEYRQKEIDIYTKANLTNNLMDRYVNTSIELLQQNKPLLAKQWLDKARPLTPRTSNNLIHEKLTEAYALYYEQIGDWKMAFQYQKKGRQLKNQELADQFNQAIQNSLLLDEHEKRQTEFRAQQKEMALRNKLSFVLVILFLGVCLAGVLFYRLFVKYKKISTLHADLIKEQDHRTKNNLQSVSNLLSLQLNQLTDPVAVRALEESVMRVDAMLLLHRELYQGEKLIEVNLKKYIPDLIQSVLRSYDLEHTNVMYEVEERWLHADNAIPLGLVLNELVTNACKYALPNHPDPALTIHCYRKVGKMFLRVADNGPGFVPPSDTATFGLRLISILMRKLKATGQYRMGEGCCFELSFADKGKPAVLPKERKTSIPHSI